LNEFALIRRYFKRDGDDAASVPLGIGDDCALLELAAGHQLAVSTDTLVDGRHFLTDVDPATLGHKSLAVNLSDLAAMGATPLACLLALTLPVERARDDRWMSAFSDGFLSLSERFGCPLVGGDTTQGPLTIGVTVLGRVVAGAALRRDGAKVGDDIHVSGTLGDAAWALDALLRPPGDADAIAMRDRLERPEPRVALGQSLLGQASAAIDVSDGLAGDLAHLCTASAVGAIIHLDRLPMSEGLGRIDRAIAVRHALAGGDDYELCFTAASRQRAAIDALAQDSGVRITRIGEVTAGTGIVWHCDGREITLGLDGFDHFR
jgi:thiamine-monophosphate kinase